MPRVGKAMDRKRNARLREVIYCQFCGKGEERGAWLAHDTCPHCYCQHDATLAREGDDC